MARDPLGPVGPQGGTNPVGPAGPQGAARSLAKKKAGNKWGLPDNASNPMTWIKGIGGEAKRFFVDPMVKTLSGQEAAQNYLNPRGGVGPTRMAERAVGVMSDAMNIASLIPGVNAVARGSVAAENALSRAMANRAGEMIAPYSARAANAAKMADLAMDDSAKVANDILRSYSSLDNMYKNPFRDAPPSVDSIRFWHTSPKGEALPEKLMSMEESARLAGRRGTGSTQLLSGGVYATNSAPISSTYGPKASGVNTHIGRTMPEFMFDFPENMPGLQDWNDPNYLKWRQFLKNPIPAENKAEFMKDVFGRDITEVVPRQNKEQLWSWFSRARGMAGASPEELTGLKRSFDKAETWKDLLDFEGLKGIDDFVLKDLWTGMVRDNAGGKLFYAPESPTMLDFPNNRRALGPEIGRSFGDLARRKAILADKNNPFVLGGAKVSADWGPGQNYWDLPVKREGIFGSGQPMRISEVAGMPALDIGNMSSQQLDDVVSAVYEFVNKNVPPGANTSVLDYNIGEFYDSMVDPDATPATKLRDFRDIIDSIVEYVDGAKSTSNNFPNQMINSDELSTKEKFYQYLTDELGINAMLHPGGATVGNVSHQAVVFNRPEMLPPSTYVPSGDQLFRNAVDKYNQARYQKYYADRINRNAGRPFVGARNVSRVPSPILLPLGAGALSSTAANRR